MLKEGYLEGRWGRSRLGPKKRMYRLDKKGEEELKGILSEAIETVHDFYREYLLSLPPKANVFIKMCKLLTTKLKEQSKIAYVTSAYSVMHERLISTLHNKLPEGKIYFIKPHSMTVVLNLSNLMFLDGDYNSIPLKDEYVDLLVVTKVPEKDVMESTLREAYRVLKKDGTLAILTPAVLVHKYKDPMTIGNFVEKYEHETLERPEDIDGDFLKASLKTSFRGLKKDGSFT